MENTWNMEMCKEKERENWLYYFSYLIDFYWMLIVSQAFKISPTQKL